MGYYAGELVSGPCEDAPCCGHGLEGGCPQPGDEVHDKAYWARIAMMEDGEPPDDFFDDANEFDEEDYDEGDEDAEGRGRYAIREDFGFFGYEGTVED